MPPLGGLCSDGPRTARADLKLTQALCSSKLLAGLLHVSLLQISDLCLQWLSQNEFSGRVRGLGEAQGTLRPETSALPIPKLARVEQGSFQATSFARRHRTPSSLRDLQEQRVFSSTLRSHSGDSLASTVLWHSQFGNELCT